MKIIVNLGALRRVDRDFLSVHLCYFFKKIIRPYSIIAILLSLYDNTIDNAISLYINLTELNSVFERVVSKKSV